MTSTSRSALAGWLRKVGLGIAVVAGLAVLAAGALVAVTFRGYARGFAIEQELARQSGGAGSYVVPSNGGVPSGRMAHFIEVRRRLAPRCGEVTRITEPLKRVSATAAEDRPAAGVLFGQILDAASGMPSLGLVFGRYVEARNRALLAARMGLDEYAWVYVVSYFAYLHQPPMGVIESPTRTTIFVDRVFPAAASLIERHVAQAGLSGGPWVDELARLRADPARVPFAGNLPPELAASVAPHRDALLDAACPAAAELDLTLTVPRSVIGYDHK